MLAREGAGERNGEVDPSEGFRQYLRHGGAAGQHPEEAIPGCGTHRLGGQTGGMAAVPGSSRVSAAEAEMRKGEPVRKSAKSKMGKATAA